MSSTPAERKRRKHFFQQVYEGQSDLSTLAESMRMSLEQLAHWACDDDKLDILRSMRELAEMRSSMLLSRYRVTAAAKLVALTSQSEDAELARKSAVDLLKLDVLPASDSIKATNSNTASAPRINPDHVLNALEKIGESPRGK